VPEHRAGPASHMAEPMNDADDKATAKHEAASSATVGSRPPVTGLSAEDEAVVVRWRGEVGEDRLHRIAVTLAAGRPGRKSEEADRLHLLLMMARFSRANPNTKPNRLAFMVVASPEGMAECLRSNATKDALNRWLRDRWSKIGPKLKREIAAAEERSAISNVLKMLDTIGLAMNSLKNTPAPDWLQTGMTAPVPPALQAFLTSPSFEVLSAVLAPNGKSAERVWSLLPLLLEKTPAN
jgi:hypothetical protein